MEKRLGSISIIVERQVAPVDQVNELLSQFGGEVIARLGLPYPQRGVNIITLITDTSVERLSALTGKLGRLPGVQVRSMMAKPRAAGVHTHEPVDDNTANHDEGCPHGDSSALGGAHGLNSNSHRLGERAVAQ